MNVRPLAPDDASALAELAAREDVARFGDHARETPRNAWARWLGPSDPNTGVVLGAFRGTTLEAALRVSLIPHRRRLHSAPIAIVASAEPEGDTPLYALLTAALDACDRWYALLREELRCPADHPRVGGLFRELGFSPEARLSRSVAGLDGTLGDEIVLARLRHGIASIEAAPPPVPPRGERTGQPHVRSARASDARELAETMSEPSVVWGTLQLPLQRSDRWAERLAASDPSRVVFLVVEIDGRVAGAGALTRGEEPRRDHGAKLGMHVSERHQGRGIGRALMDALLERAEHQLGVSRVELAVYPDNARAVRLYESAGFAHEGRCRCASFRDGAYVDDALMAKVVK